MPELRENAIVLAKWPSDGWYYESKVLKNLGNGKYKLESKFKDVKQVYREDIYYKQGNQILKVSFVLIFSKLSNRFQKEYKKTAFVG